MASPPQRKGTQAPEGQSWAPNPAGETAQAGFELEHSATRGLFPGRPLPLPRFRNGLPYLSPGSFVPGDKSMRSTHLKPAGGSVSADALVPVEPMGKQSDQCKEHDACEAPSQGL